MIFIAKIIIPSRFLKRICYRNTRFKLFFQEHSLCDTCTLHVTVYSAFHLNICGFAFHPCLSSWAIIVNACYLFLFPVSWRRSQTTTSWWTRFRPTRTPRASQRLTSKNTRIISLLREKNPCLYTISNWYYQLILI